MHIKLNWLDKSLAQLNLIRLGNLCVYVQAQHSMCGLKNVLVI